MACTIPSFAFGTGAPVGSYICTHPSHTSTSSYYTSAKESFPIYIYHREKLFLILSLKLSLVFLILSLSLVCYKLSKD